MWVPVEDQLVSVGEDEGGGHLRRRFAGGAQSKLSACSDTMGGLGEVSALFSCARSSAEKSL